MFLAIKLRVLGACLVCREAWEILALGVQDILKVQSVIIFMLTTFLTVSSCYNINIRTTYFKIMVKRKLDSFWDPARGRISWKVLWTFKCQDKTQTWSLFISYNKRRLSRMVYAFSQLQSQYTWRYYSTYYIIIHISICNIYYCQLLFLLLLSYFLVLMAIRWGMWNIRSDQIRNFH